MTIIKLIIGLLFVILMIIFGVANMNQVVIYYYFGGPISIPVFFLILISISAGVILASIIALIDQIKMKREIYKKNKRIKQLDSELSLLRNLPVTEESMSSIASTEKETLKHEEEIKEVKAE